MELQLQGSGSVKVSDGTFGREYKESLVHQVVTACLSGARAGTAQQKTRSQVRGGGIKPWRQIDGVKQIFQGLLKAPRPTGTVSPTGGGCRLSAPKKPAGSEDPAVGVIRRVRHNP